MSEAIIYNLAVKDVDHELDAGCELTSSEARIPVSIAQTIVNSNLYTLAANAGRFNPTVPSDNNF